MRDTFSQASELLGQDLGSLPRGPAEELNSPQYAAGDAAAWRYIARGRRRIGAGDRDAWPRRYTALVASGALVCRCGALVQFRARAMQEAVPAGVGAMAAFGLDDDAVRGMFRGERANSGGGHASIRPRKWSSPTTRRCRAWNGNREPGRQACGAPADSVPSHTV